MNEINRYLSSIIDKQSLSEPDMIRAAQIILSGGATPAQLSTFSAIIMANGITHKQLAALVQASNKHVTKINTHYQVLDIVDFNNDILTFLIVSFITAACNIKVARYIESSVLLYMFLKEFNINIATNFEEAKLFLDEIGLCFLQPTYFNKSFKHFSFLKQEFDFQNIFSYAMPFAHPISVTNYLLKLDSHIDHQVITQFIKNNDLINNAAIIEHKKNNSTLVKIINKKNNNFTVRKLILDQPYDNFCYEKNNVNYSDCLFIFKQILSGDKKHSYRKQIVTNSAIALICYNLTNDIKTAIDMVEYVIDNKVATQKLHQMAELSNSYKN